jgi:AP-3 complex subunit beta
LCNLLIDVDEWGQVVIINMLTRYSRTQFVSPNPISEVEKEENDKKVNEDDKEEESDEDENDFDAKFNTDSSDPKNIMDPDHRLLLKVTKPLLQSRNSAVNKIYNLSPLKKVYR